MTPKRLAVAGGGLAGLLAAAAAAPHCDEVVVVDPHEGAGRAAPTSPHAAQLHHVLTRGQRHLEQVLPCFRSRVLDAGAIEASVADETHVYEFGGRGTERSLGLTVWSAPLGVLWETARSLLPGNVQFLEDASVDALTTEDGRVQAVDLRSGPNRSRLHVDGLVDASGYSTLGPRLLRASYPALRTTEQRLDRWFVTLRLQRPSDWCGAKDFWMVFGDPPDRDVALLSPLSDEEWVLGVSSQSKQDPPRDLDEITRFLDRLPGPPLRPVLAGAAPVGAPAHFRRRSARWRHYEELTPLLEGFAPLGDAYAAINPVYGQGIGAAAWHASILDEALRAEGVQGPWAGGYLAGAHEIVAQCWALDEVPVPLLSIEQWRELGGSLATDAAAHRRYVAIWHLLEPASCLHELVPTSAGTSAPASEGLA
jgi:2-polyprenyl-6-methoxyphenol hydroxylase-like FAD-dependent oxidoreductase